MKGRALWVALVVATGAFMTNMPAMAGNGSGPLAALRAYQAHFEKTSVEEDDGGEVKERGNGRYSALISAAARKHGVPVSLAKAIVRIESNFNARARGSHGEIGLMQIKPATARGIGYRGSVKALYDPATNLEWGMRYLAKAHQLASGDTCGTVLRYNAGHYARHMNPVSKRYCHRVIALLGDVV